MDEPIRVMKEGKVARLFLNRPQAFNAFDLNMIQQFSECLITLSADDTVGAVGGRRIGFIHSVTPKPQE